MAAGSTADHAICDFVTVFVLAFYWLVERATIKEAVVRLASLEHAADVYSIWAEMEYRLGGWMRGELILMAAVGLVAGVGYAAIGLPNAILLGLVSELLEVVPMIGHSRRSPRPSWWP